MTERKRYSNLELIARVDAWPYFQHDPQAYRSIMSKYWYFKIHGVGTPLGYMHHTVIEGIKWPAGWIVDKNRRFLILKPSEDDEQNIFERRSQLMQETLQQAQKQIKLPNWTDELFPIYGPDGSHLMDLDGCGVECFGIINYACHMLGWTSNPEGIRYWVPRRSHTKRNFPGMLDNTVGGSLSSGENPVDCIVRECLEEASLPEHVTRANVKACGILSFTMNQTDLGEPGCQHQVQYLYEMELDPNHVLKPNDGEVHEFHLMSLEEVKEALALGEFKLNCAMSWIAFLIRHGHITAENEKDLVEICARMHRKHDLWVLEDIDTKN